MFTINQRGIAPILIIFTLLVGLIGGLILIKNPAIFQPKAGGGLPSSPETSFTLVQDTSQQINNSQIRVNLLIRSDIAAANLFSAILKFPPDFLEVESIQTDEESSRVICAQVITAACSPTDPQICREFPTPCDVPVGWIKVQGESLQGSSVEKRPAASTSPASITNWLERYFDNSTGDISLIGGIPNPGIQTNITQPSFLMATIVFKVKKEATINISFDDSSAIYSNEDNLNILTIKRDLDIKFQPLTIQELKGNGDGNRDGKTDLKDMSILLSKFNTKVSGEIDLNGDEIINSLDFFLMVDLLKEKKVIKG